MEQTSLRLPLVISICFVAPLLGFPSVASCVDIRIYSGVWSH